VAEVSREFLKAAVSSEAVTVSREIKTITNISYYLHVKRTVTSATNQVTSQQNTHLKSKSKRTTNSINTLLIFIKNPQLYTTRAS
jgi:hypothetical protein